MRYCHNCGKETRTLCPVYVGKVGSTFGPDDRVVSRQAMTPEQDAAIPWGEHPDDGDFAGWCASCATDTHSLPNLEAA